MWAKTEFDPHFDPQYPSKICQEKESKKMNPNELLEYLLNPQTPLYFLMADSSVFDGYSRVC